MKNFTLTLAILFSLLIVSVSKNDAFAKGVGMKKAVFTDDNSDELFYNQSYEIPTFYSGLQISYGTRAFSNTSNIKELNGLKTIKDGGSLQYIFGTDIVKLPIGFGLYKTGIQETKTIGIVEFEMAVNVSLLKLANINTGRFNVYSVTGANINSYSFLGGYIPESDRRVNRKTSGNIEPLIGRVNTVNMNVGLGFEYKIIDDFNFLHIFAEYKRNIQVNEYSNDVVLQQTHVKSTSMVNVGLKVGIVK